MSETVEFGRIVLIASAGIVLALASSRLSERVRVPAPALFLLAAAIASDVFPALGDAIAPRDVARIGTVALIAVLFDGGMELGWRRFRGSLEAVVALGLGATFVTAVAVAVLAHLALGLSWQTAGLIGAALAPTDPAVMFSVLGRREVAGRSGVMLAAESGANDPVGIALVVALLGYAAGDASPAGATGTFVVEMAVGTAVGLAGAGCLRLLIQRVALPSESLYPLRTLAVAGLIYGAAAVLHGSGFLAVFVAGVLVGDVRAPYKAAVERFHGAIASLAEIVVFVTLGLTVDLGDIALRTWVDGLAVAAVLVLVARPLAVAVVLARADVTRAERLFVAWGGLRGAVPILLAAFAVDAGVADAGRIYGVVFVVVLVSVAAQGALLPAVAHGLGIRMEPVEPEPWDLGLRLQREPRGVRRFVVAEDGEAVGQAIRDLPLGEHAWIGLVVRAGGAERAAGSTVLLPGDEVVLLEAEADDEALRRLFEGRPAEDRPSDAC